MICNAYGAWTWETLRRIPDYIKLYNSLVKLGFSEGNLGQKACKIIASRSFSELEEWGLLLPANPKYHADKANVFWHPNVFKSVVRFHVIPDADIDPKHKPIQLSKFPAHITHFCDMDGSYHIRFMGEKFWFQIQCDNLKTVDEYAYIGLKFNRAIDPERRIKTVSEMYGIYNKTIPLTADLHVPRQLDLHKKSVLAYDVRTAGGTWKDVIIALNGEKILNESVDYFNSRKEDARNKYNRAEAFINGDYLAILNRN